MAVCLPGTAITSMQKVFYNVGRAADLAPGQARLVTVGDDPDWLLVRTDDGQYHAVGSLCPHQNEPLDRGRIEGCEVVCRRHHLRFDLRSGNCTNAGGYSVRTMEVRIDGDNVLVGRWEH